MIKYSSKFCFLLLFSVVAFLAMGCMDPNVSVKAVVPGDNATNVSRTSAVLVTISAANEIRQDQLTNENFKLENMGRDYHPPASGTSTSPGTSISTTTPTTTTNGTTTDGTKEVPAKDDSSTSGTATDKKPADGTTVDKGSLVPAAIPYFVGPQEGVRKEGNLTEYRIALSPTIILSAQSTYRFTVKLKAIDSTDNNTTTTDYVSYFTTGNLPDANAKEAKLVRSEPVNFLATSSTTKPTKASANESDSTDEPDDESVEDEDNDPEKNKDKDKDKTQETTTSPGKKPESKGILIDPEQGFIFVFNIPIIPSEFMRRIIFRAKDLDRGTSERVGFIVKMIEDPAQSDQRFLKYNVETEESLTGIFTMEYMRKSVTLRSEPEAGEDPAELVPLYMGRNEHIVEIEETDGQSNQRRRVED